MKYILRPDTHVKADLGRFALNLAWLCADERLTTYQVAALLAPVYKMACRSVPETTCRRIIDIAFAAYGYPEKGEDWSYKFIEKVWKKVNDV